MTQNKKNNRRRTLIVGDIHGCFLELQNLLHQADFNPFTDRLISVGDVVGKGPKQKECLDFFLEHQFEMILGNHEKYIISQIYQKNNHRFSDYLHYLETLPLFIEEKDFLIVHAGLLPGKKPQEMNSQLITTLRVWKGKPWYDQYHGKKLTIFGHWSAKGLVIKNNCIGLDTGCVYGGQLTALSLPDKKIFQVPALKQYTPIVPIKYD
jgi:diadenosine tetraphosphatase ApaH/serine/threonine PP2A family protein phosphatase